MDAVVVYIGVGANLCDPASQVEQAIATISERDDCRLVAQSSLYQSKPMGPQDQPDYINAVIALETTLPPIALLDALQSIEQQQGRVRQRHWGERTLDLDILLYGNQMIDHPRLTVPHYGMTEREFVLLPLAEIATGLILPCGTPLVEFVSQCEQNGMIRVENKKR